MTDFTLSHSNGIHIPHLSASTINSFIEYRTNFYNNKVLRKPFHPNPNMCRGTAVEHAVNEWIADSASRKVEDYTEEALQKYDEEYEPVSVQMEGYDKDQDEIRSAIPGLVTCAINHFGSKFDLSFNPPECQSKMNLSLPDLKRDFFGYLDYIVPNQQVIDCKVVGRSPSKLKQSYVIQGSLYRKAFNLPVTFDFIVANKTPKAVSLTLTDEEYSFGLRYAIRAGQIIEELEECEDPKRVMELMAFPNLEAFWNKEERTDVAREWGITP